MLRTFYYINALTGESVETSFRDRNLRLLFVEALYEMSTLFDQVMASNQASSSSNSGSQGKNSNWSPDMIACTYLSVHAIMVLLPLPDVLFHLILKLADFGLHSTSSATSVTTVRIIVCRLQFVYEYYKADCVCFFLFIMSLQNDLEANLATSFTAEFKDVFELASNRAMPLPVLNFLKTTLEATTQAKAGVPRIASSVMRSKVTLSPQSRAASRLFLLKFIVTIVATVLLGAYLFR